MPELTPKQSRFVEEYLRDLNATQAAIRAGYSAKTAGDQGAQLIAKPHILAAIEAAKGARSAETKIDAAWVLKRLAVEADADMADLYFENGAIKPVHEWPKIWRQGLVAGVEHVEIKDAEGNATGDHVVKIKVSDRVRRLELIGKHVNVNAFQEQVNHTGLDALGDRLERALARAGGKGGK
ncbi:phage terminase small subunit [Bradyrhizobium elkanii]